MAKETKILRFATREEVEALPEPTGYIQQQHDDYPPSDAQVDAYEHPEHWYCAECDASFASHITNGGHTR